MNLVQKYIDKKMLGYKADENPYTHDLISETLFSLNELNIYNPKDRIMNHSKYVKASVLISWIKQDNLQNIPLGIVQNIELPKFKNNVNFRKKISNHVAYNIFN